MYLIFINLRRLDKPAVQPCSVSSAELSVQIFPPLPEKQLHQTFPSSLAKKILFQIELKLEKGEMFSKSSVYLSAAVLFCVKVPRSYSHELQSQSSCRDGEINVTLFCCF